MRENQRDDHAPFRHFGLDCECFIVSGTKGPPAHFETGESHATLRPEGQRSFEETLDLGSRAVIYCRENGIRKLLIDLTKATGLGLPGTIERFAVGERLAYDAQSAVKVAFVAGPEVLDPSRFAVLVARNRGLFTSAFTSEAEALEWLLKTNAE